MPLVPNRIPGGAAVRAVRAGIWPPAELTDDWQHQSQAGPRAHRRRVAAIVSGLVLSAVGAYAATNWIVGLNGGSSGESQSGSVSNLTISAVASPAAGNLLFPTVTVMWS
jgi:hypothetical protein